MIGSLAGIVIMAVLFAVFGFVGHNADCSGNCAGCTGTCDHWESSDDNA
jgi:hypothetical protein